MAIVETIRFRLQEGVRDTDFLDRNRRLQKNYMEPRPGFRSRNTARSDDGEWLVFVEWATVADAQATIDAFMQAPEAKEFLEVVNPETVAQGRYELQDY